MKYKQTRTEVLKELEKKAYVPQEQYAPSEFKWVKISDARELLLAKEKQVKDRDWKAPVYTKECLDVWGPPKPSEPMIEKQDFGQGSNWKMNGEVVMTNGGKMEMLRQAINSLLKSK
jgi:hypothetical protein